jgi:hypothetical protein
MCVLTLILQKGNYARLDVDVIFTVAAHAHLFIGHVPDGL